jgi:hypothetical protein
VIRICDPRAGSTVSWSLRTSHLGFRSLQHTV